MSDRVQPDYFSVGAYPSFEFETTPDVKGSESKLPEILQAVAVRVEEDRYHKLTRDQKRLLDTLVKEGHPPTAEKKEKMVELPSGAKRGSREGKGRFDLLPWDCLHRVARHYEKGGKRFDDPNNWKRGIPSSWFMDSAVRHAARYLAGDRSEDHLSAIVFNVLGAMFNELNNPKYHDLDD